VVQRLVPADAAGVCFTLDPVTGGSDRALVNASFGLGESVVNGRVSPDTFAVDKTIRKVVLRNIATKHLKVVPAPGGTREVALAEPLGRRASVSDEQVVEIAGLALAIEESEGRAVDIEWAVCGGEIFVLQSRPVTAVGRDHKPLVEEPPEDWIPELNTPVDPRYPVYSNGNISEVLPGCITPLSWSYIGPTIEHAFRSQGEALGAMEPGGPEYQVLGFFFHRPYVCVSFLEVAAERTPGLSPDTVHEEFIGPPEKIQPAVRTRDLWPARWPAIARVGLTLLRKVAGLEREARACEERMRRRWAESRPEHVKTWSDQRLLEEVRFSEREAKLSDVHVWASSFAVAQFGILRKLTRAWLGDDDGSLAARMVTGIGGLPSADPAFGLWELARGVTSEPALAERFESIRDDAALLAALDELGGPGRGFRRVLDRFLDVFGHRAVCEAEFRNPCWREDPAQVLALVRNYLQPGVLSPEAVRERQQRVGREASARLGELFPLKRVLLRQILRRTRRSMELREQLKDLIVLRSDRARGIYAEVRRRLVARKQLADPDDLYFLLCGELAELLTGVLRPKRAEEIVLRRRCDFAWCQAVRVPKIQELVPKVATEEGLTPERRLQGVGVSPGRVEGRARVILDPRLESHIEPGEILVAPVTDAGWTPLFINAAGLVVEVGGLLSHGSVVAREYGLPAVVGASGATRRIRTGDHISLDGSSGLVLLPDSS
jgi:pyruvate,water dikinase